MSLYDELNEVIIKNKDVCKGNSCDKYKRANEVFEKLVSQGLATRRGSQVATIGERIQTNFQFNQEVSK